MGYRSDVVVIIHKDIIADWMQHLCQHEEAREIVFSDRDHSDTNFNNEGHLLYRWTSVKWYDIYDEVTQINDFLNSQDDENFRFVRTGEEGEDYEEEGYLCSDLVFAVVTNYINIDGI